MSLVNLIKSQLPRDFNIMIGTTEKGNYVVSLPSGVAREPSKYGNQEDRIIKFFTTKNFSKKSSPVKFKYLGSRTQDGTCQIFFAYIPYKEVLENEKPAEESIGNVKMVKPDTQDLLKFISKEEFYVNRDQDVSKETLRELIKRGVTKNEINKAINGNFKPDEFDSYYNSILKEVENSGYFSDANESAMANEMAFNIAFDSEEKNKITQILSANNSVKDVFQTADKVTFTDLSGREWKVTKGKANFYIYSNNSTEEIKVGSFDELLNKCKTLTFTMAGTPKDLKLKALKEVHQKMLKLSRPYDEEFDEDNLEFQIRDWGNWQVPNYYRSDPDYADEDFSDWDWNELTDEWADKLKEIIKEVNKKYGTKIYSSGGEKNWITIAAESVMANEMAVVTFTPEEFESIENSLKNNGSIIKPSVQRTGAKITFQTRNKHNFIIVRGPKNCYIYSNELKIEKMFDTPQSMYEFIQKKDFSNYGDFDNQSEIIFENIIDKLGESGSWESSDIDSESLTITGFGSWVVDDSNDLVPDQYTQEAIDDAINSTEQLTGAKIKYEIFEGKVLIFKIESFPQVVFECASFSTAMGGAQTCAPLGISESGVPHYFNDICNTYNKYISSGLSKEDIIDKICKEMNFNKDVFTEKFKDIFPANECYEKYIDEDSEADDIKRRLKNKSRSISAEKAWKKYRSNYNAGIRKQENK